MSEKTTTAAGPTVKLTPEFKVGETVTHLGEGTTHTILAISPLGYLQLSEVATLIEPSAVSKK
jgi:hypothetical protein